MRMRIYILWAGIAGIVLPPLVVPFITPWSEINCRHQEVNIRTGQARFSQKLWFVTVSQRVEDTSLSLALQGESVEAADTIYDGDQAWHLVNTFSPGIGHSPHYNFHGALAQTAQLNLIATEYDLSPEKRAEIARLILTAWQQSGDYFTADEVLEQVWAESRED